MGSDSINMESGSLIHPEQSAEPSAPYYLAKFKLYETRSNFYMVGRDKSKRIWRILKIDRSEPSELFINEDPTEYSFPESCAILRRIHEGNMRTGGLKFVTTCYGIVGFVKLLGPYYALLITERRKIGMICGHAIYAVSKSKMIPIPHSTVQSNMDISKNENRYKKLLCNVDITKDFFFSYSYQIMHSLQNNMCSSDTGIDTYNTMFVWNSFLTREARSILGNTLWTVALIHGFFKQVKLSKSGRSFSLTLIARRSRHYAGTRYLKRGVSKKGRAANDVETEQIVFEEISSECSSGISSVVQIRGSIPLFWSQETSRLNIKPAIMLSREDQNYLATQLHFQDLVSRYGNPIIILNLIKKEEKKPRESILHAEYVKAVGFINRSLSKENRLKFRTLDLNKLFRMKGSKVLMLLNKVSAYALDQTGLFKCQLPRLAESGEPINLFEGKHDNNSIDILKHKSAVPSRLQRGVLRTNCIDCLDRTNVAQYAYGFVALGHQLHALGITETPKIDFDDPLANRLMNVYEAMGDTLALQYGGSPAHNKIFSERRGQWKAATQSQELLRTLQRYWSNAYMDSVKQDAINLFLGNFQPEVGRPALWEMGPDHHYTIGSLNPSFSEDFSRSMLRRSLSDGNLGGLIGESSSSPIMPSEVGAASHSDNPLPNITEDVSVSHQEMLACEDSMSTIAENQVSYSRYTPPISARQLLSDMQEGQCVVGECSNYFGENGDDFNSDILDLDWISSSANSCEDEGYDRSSLVSSPGASSYGHAMNDTTLEGRAHSTPQSTTEFPDTFVRWVENDAMFVA